MFVLSQISCFNSRQCLFNFLSTNLRLIYLKDRNSVALVFGDAKILTVGYSVCATTQFPL